MRSKKPRPSIKEAANTLLMSSFLLSRGFSRGPPALTEFNCSLVSQTTQAVSTSNAPLRWPLSSLFFHLASSIGRLFRAFTWNDQNLPEFGDTSVISCNSCPFQAAAATADESAEDSNMYSYTIEGKVRVPSKSFLFNPIVLFFSPFPFLSLKKLLLQKPAPRPRSRHALS